MNHNKDLVRSILENANAYQWSVQGLGMLRLYISERLRLHIWHSDLAVPNASALHTHPWDFKSTIVAGRIKNKIYQEIPEHDEPNAKRAFIKCGEGCHVLEEKEVRLGPVSNLEYTEGMTYSMIFHRIHKVEYDDGTVTLCDREFMEDRDHAYVYYPIQDDAFVSAEPRPASPDEVSHVVGFTLNKYFGENNGKR